MGFTCDFVYLNDLWFYDPVQDEWARPLVTGKPPKRDHHASAYVDGHLYIHGGKLTDQVESARKDLWRYDLVSRTWSELRSPYVPSSRYLHHMAAWPGGHALILFGGEHIKSRKSGNKKYARLNDVWAFSSQTGNWTQLIADTLDAAPELATSVLSDAAQLAIALVVALVVTAAALRARFGGNDDGAGPLGVTASPATSLV